MNLSLTPQLEQFVRDQAASGDYNNASEVVREAIRLLKRTDQIRKEKLSILRKSISIGDEAIANGESDIYRSEKELDSFFDKL